MNIFVTIICVVFFRGMVFCDELPPSWLVIPEKTSSAASEHLSAQKINLFAEPAKITEQPEIVDFELPQEFLTADDKIALETAAVQTDECLEARELLKDFNSRLAVKEKVRVLLSAKNYTELLPLAGSLICIEPENREMLYIHAHALRALRDYEKAADSYDRLVGLYADFFDGWYERADVYRRLKAAEEALASYDQAVKLKPENSWAQYDRAVHLKNMRRWDEASEGFNEAIRLNPRNSWAYYELGNIHFWRRQFVHALRYYQETKKLNPKAPSLDENIAICEKALSER